MFVFDLVCNCVLFWGMWARGGEWGEEGSGGGEGVP